MAGELRKAKMAATARRTAVRISASTDVAAAAKTPEKKGPATRLSRYDTQDMFHPQEEPRCNYCATARWQNNGGKALAHRQPAPSLELLSRGHKRRTDGARARSMRLVPGLSWRQPMSRRLAGAYRKGATQKSKSCMGRRSEGVISRALMKSPRPESGAWGEPVVSLRDVIKRKASMSDHWGSRVHEAESGALKPRTPASGRGLSGDQGSRCLRESYQTNLMYDCYTLL